MTHGRWLQGLGRVGLWRDSRGSSTLSCLQGASLLVPAFSSKKQGKEKVVLEAEVYFTSFTCSRAWWGEKGDSGRTCDSGSGPH
jgi:hypothetical protein